MNIDYEMELKEVYVAPTQGDFTNVVTRVLWTISFFDTNTPDVKTDAIIESYLEVGSLNAESFTPFENLTQIEILEKCLAHEGGTGFLDGLLESAHAPHLAKLIADSQFESKDLALIPTGS